MDCGEKNNHDFREPRGAPERLWLRIFWCGRGDLNPHAFRRHPLKMVCLPISPLPHADDPFKYNKRLHRKEARRRLRRSHPAFMFARRARPPSKRGSGRRSYWPRDETPCRLSFSCSKFVREMPLPLPTGSCFSSAPRGSFHGACGSMFAHSGDQRGAC